MIALPKICILERKQAPNRQVFFILPVPRGYASLLPPSDALHGKMNDLIKHKMQSSWGIFKPIHCSGSYLLKKQACPFPVLGGRLLSGNL